jgi:hypothetical protein
MDEVAVKKYIPQIDYTSRDYTSIREDLISLIPNFAPNWTNRDPADFGMTILEAFAYMGDGLNYYIDRAANESFITTASQRDSVLQLARLLGYQATNNTAARVTLTFQNSTASNIVVPALTKVATTNVTSSSSEQIVFETATSVTVPATGSITVTANQGTTVASEVIGTSNGESSQIFKLSKSPVIEKSVTLTVNSVTYTQVPYLIDYQNYDPVFSTYTNAEGITYVLFGDNVSGRIPPVNAQITATYRTGGGASGNVGVNTIKYILTNGVSGLSVLNQYISASDTGVASGGGDFESTDAIRVNAPLSLRTLDRAVSLSDYANLCIKGGAAKAVAIADVYTSVTVYFAPFGDKGVTGDGVTPSNVFNTTATSLKTYLSDKIPANTTITFQPPSYVDVYIDADITVLPQYKQSLVLSEVTAKLDTLFQFDNVIFADRVTLNDVTSAVNSVAGVAYVETKKLVRKDADITKVVDLKTLTSGVANLRTTTAHGLKIGDTVKITGIDNDFNGVFVVTTIPTTTTFTYACSGTTITATAVVGGAATKLTVGDIICELNEIPQKPASYTWGLTVTGGITV